MFFMNSVCPEYKSLKEISSEEEKFIDLRKEKNVSEKFPD